MTNQNQKITGTPPVFMNEYGTIQGAVPPVQQPVQAAMQQPSQQPVQQPNESPAQQWYGQPSVQAAPTYNQQNNQVCMQNMQAMQQPYQQANAQMMASYRPQGGQVYNRPVPQVYGAVPVNTNSPVQNTGGHSDAESAFGKILMAVFAGILLLISLGIFAAVVFPDLTSEAKLAVMYGISGVFWGVGFGLSFKFKKNPAVITLASCGTAMLYLSTLIGLWGFEVLNCWVASGILIGLSALIAWSSHKFSSVVSTVGSLSLTICSALYIFDDQRDMAMGAILMMIAYLISFVMYFFWNFHKEYHRNWMHWVSYILVSFAVCCNCTDYRGIYSPLVYVLAFIAALGAVAVLALGYTTCRVHEKYTVGFGIYPLLIYVVMGAILSNVLLNQMPDVAADGITLLLAVPLLVFAEIKIPLPFRPGKIITALAITGCVCSVIGDDFERYAYLGFAFFALAMTIYGFLRNDLVYKICAMFFMLAMLCCDSTLLKLGVSVAVFLVFTVFFAIYKKQYHSAYKLILCFMFILLLLHDSFHCLEMLGVSSDNRRLIFLTTLWTLNFVLAIVPAFHRHPVTGKKECGLWISNMIVIAICMLTNLAYIGMNEELLQVAFVALGVLMWAGTTALLLMRSRNSWTAFGIAAMWMIFMVFTLQMYDVPGFVISLTALVFAICCIVIGFVVSFHWGCNYAPIRIYGLIVVLSNVLKLLLWDFDYPSMLARAFSFFATGMLCLGISIIYSLIERKAKKG